jgi:hypothetical protein
MTSIKHIIRWIWRALCFRCQECGGVRGMESAQYDHSIRGGIVWTYCFSCGFYCQCVRDSQEVRPSIRETAERLGMKVRPPEAGQADVDRAVDESSDSR